MPGRSHYAAPTKHGAMIGQCSKTVNEQAKKIQKLILCNNSLCKISLHVQHSAACPARRPKLGEFYCAWARSLKMPFLIVETLTRQIPDNGGPIRRKFPISVGHSIWAAVDEFSKARKTTSPSQSLPFNDLRRRDKVVISPTRDILDFGACVPASNPRRV